MPSEMQGKTGAPEGRSDVAKKVKKHQEDGKIAKKGNQIRENTVKIGYFLAILVKK